MDTIITEFETNFEVIFKRITNKYSKDNPKIEIIAITNGGEAVPVTPILTDLILNSDSYEVLVEGDEGDGCLCLSSTLVGGSKTIEVMYANEIYLNMDIYPDFHIVDGTYGPEITIYETCIVNDKDEYNDIKFGSSDEKRLEYAVFDYAEQVD
jgi:hypothetical protein